MSCLCSETSYQFEKTQQPRLKVKLEANCPVQAHEEQHPKYNLEVNNLSTMTHWKLNIKLRKMQSIISTTRKGIPDEQDEK